MAGYPTALALQPGDSRVESPRISISGSSIVVELRLPNGGPETALRCCIQANARELARLQHHFHRAGNHRRTEWAISGMVLLLAVCGWIIGGADGARWAVTGGTPAPDGSPISPELMRRQFGARPLHPADVPALFEILRHICLRARLPRLPDLYYLAAPHSMNAYALGGPHGSAITLTEGLLRDLTLGEIAGILAHEVAHISNNDTWSMTWAVALHRAIALTSLIALSRQAEHGPASPLAMLLHRAPAIGELLCLALSRIRELDADATALELIDDPQALVAALHKLERHHTGLPVMAAVSPAESSERFLSSHPATAERVGLLLRLAH
jgi:heat shock protein HtpX